jgi:hypothetical protein
MVVYATTKEKPSVHLYSRALTTFHKTRSPTYGTCGLDSETLLSTNPSLDAVIYTRFNLQSRQETGTRSRTIVKRTIMSLLGVAIVSLSYTPLPPIFITMQYFPNQVSDTRGTLQFTQHCRLGCNFPGSLFHTLVSTEGFQFQASRTRNPASTPALVKSRTRQLADISSLSKTQTGTLKNSK